MKIHIDTSTPQNQAKAKQVPAKTVKKKPATPPTSGSPPPSGQPATGGQPQGPSLPKKPPKEPKAPPDVIQARQQQTQVLKARQGREVAGKIQGAPRDVDAGSGFWPPLSPFL